MSSIPKYSWKTPKKKEEHFIKHVLCVDEHWEDVPKDSPLILHFGTKRNFVRWRTYVLESFKEYTGVQIGQNLSERLDSPEEMFTRSIEWKGYGSWRKEKRIPSATSQANDLNLEGLEKWCEFLHETFPNWEQVFDAHIAYLIQDGNRWALVCDYRDKYIKRKYISRYAQQIIVQKETILTSYRYSSHSCYNYQVQKLKNVKYDKFIERRDEEIWKEKKHIKPTEMR